MSRCRSTAWSSCRHDGSMQEAASSWTSRRRRRSVLPRRSPAGPSRGGGGRRRSRCTPWLGVILAACWVQRRDQPVDPGVRIVLRRVAVGAKRLVDPFAIRARARFVGQSGDLLIEVGAARQVAVFGPGSASLEPALFAGGRGRRADNGLEVVGTDGSQDGRGLTECAGADQFECPVETGGVSQGLLWEVAGLAVAVDAEALSGEARE